MMEDLDPGMPKPLEGKLVQIHTGYGVTSKTISGREKKPSAAVAVDQQYGQVIGWDKSKECYVVQTFEGHTVLLDESNLEVCGLNFPEEGGADIVYPIGGSPDEFGVAIVDWLANKGFCMVQMTESKETRRDAALTIAEIGTAVQESFRQELESAYLGTNNITKVVSLPPGDESAEATGDEDALGILRSQMLAVFNAAGLFVEEYFGHSCWATTSIWARESADMDEVDAAPPLNGKDVVDGTYIQAYDRFVQGRKLCVLYLVANDGGEIRLWPRLGSDLAVSGVEPVTLPISANKMIIFRHDQMSYSYQPKGSSVALQSWMLSDIPVAQQNMKIHPLTGVKEAPPGQNAQIMMLDSRMPGDALGLDKLWNMFQSGTDTPCQWPVTRWETEPYYTDGDDWAFIGKSYTKHGAFMNEGDMTDFDNEFFHISDAEASIMAPGQRHTMETSYSCLFKSGHTRASLQGENIGVFWGDVGMDWHGSAAPWSFQKHPYGGKNPEGKCDTSTLVLAMEFSVTIGRLSWTFGMTGPLQSCDTACSASLVALQAGHKAMMHLATDSNKGGSISAPHSILSGGVNTMMSPFVFVGNCAASMLSHVGRCWTFDRTADGYQRGEGCGCMFMKWSGDQVDIEERLAVLVGTCSGHDGRSASLTAPNGPAQQDCIRRSMRMAGVDPSLINICECHGTGTALGDPIEIGSLQGVMRGLRTFPLINTSAKTNISHLEACAGCAGIMKCVLMCGRSCGPPNVHLRQVNANLLTVGYPVFFQQELCDTTFSTTFCGVSSFGFGGTNSRADLYGRSIVGHKNTGNLWTQERLDARALAYSYGLRNSYKGYDKLDKGTVPKVAVSIMGSWNEFKMETMDVEEPGCFTYRATLGDLRRECFQLCLGTDHNRTLCPCVDMAAADAMIAGPAGDAKFSGNMWVIDGRTDFQPSGAKYLIKFKWQGEKSISWTPESGAQSLADKKEQVESISYSICGNWNRYRPQTMTRVYEEEGCHEAELIVNVAGEAKFQILRDLDKTQMIYPDENENLCGPDRDGVNKYFTVMGTVGETMTVRLWNVNARIDVHVISASGEEEACWGGVPTKLYYVAGSFNSWSNALMSKDKFISGLYRCCVTVPNDEPVEYKVLFDDDMSEELQGISAAFPQADAEVVDAVRDFQGDVGSMWEIILDLNQDDPNRMIYHRRGTHVEKHKAALGLAIL